MPARLRACVHAGMSIIVETGSTQPLLTRRDEMSRKLSAPKSLMFPNMGICQPLNLVFCLRVRSGVPAACSPASVADSEGPQRATAGVSRHAAACAPACILRPPHARMQSAGARCDLEDDGRGAPLLSMVLEPVPVVGRLVEFEPRAQHEDHDLAHGRACHEDAEHPRERDVALQVNVCARSRALQALHDWHPGPRSAPLLVHAPGPWPDRTLARTLSFCTAAPSWVAPVAPGVPSPAPRALAAGALASSRSPAPLPALRDSPIAGMSSSYKSNGGRPSSHPICDSSNMVGIWSSGMILA